MTEARARLCFKCRKPYQESPYGALCSFQCGSDLYADYTNSPDPAVRQEARDYWARLAAKLVRPEG